MHFRLRRWFITLLLVLTSISALAPLVAAAPAAPLATTIFSEAMWDGTGNPSGTTPIATFESSNWFENDALTMSGTGDMRTTTPSSGYTGASGTWNVFLTNSVGRYFEIADINTTAYTNLVLSFGVFKSTTAENGSSLTVSVSSDGVSWTVLTVPSLPTGTGTATWHYRTASGAIPSTANLRIRFANSSATPQFRIDDVLLVGDSAGDTPPTVASTTPANGATGVPVGSDLTLTFSEPVTVSGNWFQIACTLSGTRNVGDTVVTGGPTSYTINPNADFALNESCTVTVFASQVADQDGIPDNMAADHIFSFSTPAADPCALPFTAIYSIQGSGSSAAITGAVTTQGVVVGDFELPSESGQLRGFYLQDTTGDGDPTTSDGIFVFTGGSNTVSLGQVVRVAGTAGEFSDQTQISSATVTQCSTTGSVTPVDVVLPFSAADYPERYEGMLVRFPQTLYVTEHFQLGRFGQIVLTSQASRLQQPTNVTTPGAAALALQAANNLNRVIVDDDNNTQNPDPIVFGRGGNPLSASNTLRGGDSAAGIVGVLTYGWSGNAASGNAYRLRPVGALNGGVINFTAANPRPATPSVGGRLRVTAANLLNYFNSWSGCTLGVGGGATDCRGADNLTEFNRQWPKTVANLVDGGAHVIGIMEIENDGYGASSAIQDLTTKLNNATAAGTYAFINPDTTAGTNALGTDAIKVGLIYKPGEVTPVGTTAVLNTTAFVNGGDSAARNRPALAQAFEEVSTGQRFIVVVNHLKSKGSACSTPDAGDGQGNCSGVRTNAANLMTAWLAGNPTGTGDPDILIMGDLNSYAQEDPITAIKNAGYVNLIESRLGADAYSYAFDGQWGYLDHALATAALDSQVVGVEEWHINADEPVALDYNTEFKSAGQLVSLYAADRFRSSDHDPVIIGLNLVNPLAVTLAGFDAQAQAGQVLVSWETVSEYDNAGFNLYRGDSAAGPQVLLAAIPSQGPGASQGFAYSQPCRSGCAARPDLVVLAGGCQPERRDHAARAGERDGAGADRGDADIGQRQPGGRGGAGCPLAGRRGRRGQRVPLATAQITADQQKTRIGACIRSASSARG